MSEITGAGGGGKGGKQPQPPVEQVDSLKSRSYAKVIDLLSEGEIFGPMNGIAEQCIYLDGTPIQNPDGTLNFTDCLVEVRNGTQDQDHIPGFPSIETTIPIGVQLRATAPFVRSITNTDLSAVRVQIGTNTLMTVNTETGDRYGSYVYYVIQLSTDGRPFELAVNAGFVGKNTTGYSRTHRIELPPATTGWVVRVQRMTLDSTDSAVQNATFVESITEVIDAKLRFPNSALVGIQINAEQFSSIPTRSYKWRGMFVRIPTNYNPVTREYSGVWDGTFMRGYTNNPAWVFYDLVVEDRYGLGSMVDTTMLDRYVLYQIAHYCDQLVPDGQGGMEPRFVCNVYLQQAAEALKVLQDFAAIFRGICYWAGGSIYTVSDMPSDPVYMYTNAKVKGGRFEYTGSPRHQRKTVALVSWTDPDDFSRAKVEVVENEEGIRRYGVQKLSVSPLGCTSKSQAQRVGNYILFTSLMETGGVGFTVGLDGVIPQPGNIIRVADKHRAGRNLGGLITASTLTTVTIDRDSPIAPGGQFSAILPDGTLQTRTVLNRVGRVITVTTPFSAPPTVQGQWLIDTEDLVAQYFKVISIREVTGIEFQIQAIVHHPGKYDAVDFGTRVEPLPVTVIPARVQAPPTNVTLSSFNVISQGVTRTTGVISWEAAESAVQYEIEWRRNGSEWIRAGRTGSLLVELQDIFAGEYEARVRALNSFDIPSPWANSAVTPLTGIVGNPPALSTFTATGLVMAIRLNWGFPTGLNVFERVEIRSSLTNAFSGSTLLTTVSYPTNTYTLFGLGYSTNMWFWARIIDKNGQPGPWTPSETGAGLHGQPTQDPATILQYLNGQIASGHLAPGLIEEITTDIVDDIEAVIGDQLETVEAQVAANSAAITAEQTARTTADAALTSSISLQAGRIDSNIAAIQNEATTRATAVSALTTSLNTQISRIDTATAAITAEQTTRANADGALSSALNAQISRIDNAVAAIATETTTRANADSAQATQITNLTTRVGGAEADADQAISVAAGLDGSLRAQWGVRTQVRADGRVVQAGVALGASIGPGGVARSEFIVRADLIAFVNSLNGSLKTPFVFDTVNDTAFLQAAFIQDLSVNTIKIANGAVTTMVLANQGFGALGSPSGTYAVMTQFISATSDPVNIVVNLSANAPPFYGGPLNGSIMWLYRVVGGTETEIVRMSWERTQTQMDFTDVPGPGLIGYRVYVQYGGILQPSPACQMKIFQTKR